MSLRHLHTVHQRKEKPTSPKSLSSSGMQRTPRLRARAIIAKTKDVMKRVRHLIKTKRAPGAVDAAPDVQREFGATLPLFMISRVGPECCGRMGASCGRRMNKYSSVPSLLSKDGLVGKEDHVTSRTRR